MDTKFPAKSGIRKHSGFSLTKPKSGLLDSANLGTSTTNGDGSMALADVMPAFG